MVKGKIKLLKEAVTNIFNCVTIDYPAGTWPGTKYSQIPPKLRGKQEFVEDKCIGCGACSVACSSQAISCDDNDKKRTVSIFLGQCTFCARCEEICPEDALVLTEEFELAYTGQRENEGAYVKEEVDLVVCDNCGAIVAPEPQIKRFKERLMENIDPSVKEVLAEDMEKYARYCPNCRWQLSFDLNIHTKKYY